MPIISSASLGSFTGFGLSKNNSFFGKIELDNNSGSVVTDYTFPVSVSYRAEYGNDFSKLRFLYNGKQVQHWIGNVVNSERADVYVKLPSLGIGESTLLISNSNVNLSSSNNLFTHFTDFSGAVTGPDFEVRGPGANNVTFSEGNLYMTQAESGAPIAHLATTSDAGIDMSIDAAVEPMQAAILELTSRMGVSDDPDGSLDLYQGVKTRWDERRFDIFQGFINTIERTANTVTAVLDRTPEEFVEVGDFILSIVTEDSSLNGIAEVVSVDRNSNTIQYTLEGSDVNPLTINGDRDNRQYVAYIKTSISDVNPPWDTYSKTGLQGLAASWLYNPYGGTYIDPVTSESNTAGWFFFQTLPNSDGEFLAAGGEYYYPLAAGQVNQVDIYRSKVVGDQYNSYVNNVPGASYTNSSTKVRVITAASLTNNIASIDTNSDMGFAPGETVTISGVPDSTFNGTYTITRVIGARRIEFEKTNADIAEIEIPFSDGATATVSNITRWSQNGLAGVANHLGEVNIKWAAAYPAYSNVSEATYSDL